VKVLLIEDRPGDARLVVELTREIPGSPFEVMTVGTFGAGLAAAAQHDVVFLDLSLPDAHGVANVSKLLATARHVPIVVLTGSDDEHVAVEAMKLGAQDYIHKSEITPSLIARAARYAVERKGAEENLRKLVKSDEAARRAKFISSITAAIMSSFDTNATLQEVARLLVPALGEVVAIEVVGHTGETTRVASAGRTELLAALDRPIQNPIATVMDRRSALHMVDPESIGELRAMYITPLIARDRVVGAITFAMTSSAGFGDDLQQLADDVSDRIALGIDNARLYNAAQRAIRGRDELLAVVSHDLRNPLNLVGLALQMLEHDPGALSSALPSAKRGVDRMQRLIEDLLDVARIDSGTLAIEARPTSLLTILDEAFEQHRALANDKKITLVRDYERRPGGVIADRHRIGQALSNLIGNALKFTSPGGSIRIGGDCSGDRGVLWVADTGPGIPPEHLPHMFDRFWQPSRGRDGVGLGLAIVKGIVDAHAGSIEVESVPGAGTTFRIVLRATEARTTTEMQPLALAQ
jgi:signal transduction histidine kinase